MDIKENLRDIQSEPAKLLLDIDKVGVKNVEMPLVVRDREKKGQHTIASVDMSVNLPAEYKGTHMSRFLEALQEWREINGEHLDYPSLNRLLSDILQRLNAHSSQICFRFPYFIDRKAPVSGVSAPVRYSCSLTGEMSVGESRPHFLLKVEIPVTTVCPCSKAISRNGAHGQRAVIRISLKMKIFEWMERYIEIAEKSASSPVYTILKRPDEKYVTEHGYDNARFVEDVVRNVAIELQKDKNLSWFRVEVESEESIHEHNAFACIEKAL